MRRPQSRWGLPVRRIIRRIGMRIERQLHKLGPVGSTIALCCCAVIGAVAYNFLPVAAVPNVDFPMIRVSATRPGADPTVMAGTVAAKSAKGSNLDSTRRVRLSRRRNASIFSDC